MYLEGLLKLSKDNFKKLKNLDFSIGGQIFSLTPNAQIWPRSLNSDISGDADSIYLIIADVGAASGTGLDFVNGYTFLYVPVVFLLVLRFLMMWLCIQRTVLLRI